MSKKPFSDPRWNQPLKAISLGKSKDGLTYEDEKKGLDCFYEEKIITKEEYDKDLEELKKKYNIKD